MSLNYISSKDGGRVFFYDLRKMCKGIKMKYINELIAAISTEDFYKTEDILDKVIQEDDSIEYVDALLKYMEENPLIEYGMPGPVVHFAERYYQKGYEQLLFDSLSNKPTQHTLWMLNRIINSPTLVDKEKYITLLRDISTDATVDENVRQDADKYLDYQICK